MYIIYVKEVDVGVDVLDAICLVKKLLRTWGECNNNKKQV
jgi:hypothetical protein